MLKNYLTTAIRHLLRHKGYSLINILGLAIGMACALLIGLYIQDELSYDRYHTNANQIYRVVRETNAKTPPALAPALQHAFPEIRHTIRLQPPAGIWMMRHQDRVFYEDRVYWTDDTLFDIFSFSLIQGNPETALKEPYSMVITEDTADRYFGKADAIGRIIRADDSWDFTVTGVVENLPSQSHFQADFFVSWLPDARDAERLRSWTRHAVYTYILLPGDYPASTLEQRLPAFIDEVTPQILAKGQGVAFNLTLQHLTDIHLHSHLENEADANSDIGSVYLLSAIALFILLIACINFMNLAIARSVTRAKEIGLRKVVGAYRRQLVLQFLGEALLVAFTALLVAVCIVHLALPAFNALTGRYFAPEDINRWPVVFGMFGMAMVVGLISGSYPALFLSAFLPIEVLKGKRRTIRSGLRKGLVVVQFTLSALLMIGTMVVYEQVTYLHARKLGLNPEQVIVIKGAIGGITQQGSAFKAAVEQHPHILGVTLTSAVPGLSGLTLPSINVYPVDRPDARQPVSIITTDYDFIDTMEMELAAGRGHSPDFSTDQFALVLNETAVRLLGWETPEAAVGQQLIVTDWMKGPIIGVVKDFHIRSLHHRIEPVVIFLGWYTYIAVRIHSEHLAGGLAYIEQTWKKLLPDFPLAYTFVDEAFARLYRTEEQLSQVFSVFTLVALFLACLGLFGLVAFLVQQRTREIGIRKVLGASISGLVLLLSKEFMVLVMLANLLAWPVAYVIMVDWLRNFAYRIDLHWEPFVVSGIVTLVIALLTVGAQAIKSARNNPVDTLRYE